MIVEEQIDRYISDQLPPKREDLQSLHQRIVRAFPNCRLWFLDGRNDDGKVVSNPNIGYGSQTITYAGGETREFYQVGLSANTTGISLYIIGLEDKQHLSRVYGDRIGKASITGYCIKFKSLMDIDADVFDEIVATHMGAGAAVGA